MDQRRSIIANLIRQSQPAQLNQQLRGQIGAVQSPGYRPLGMQAPAAPMQPAPTQAGPSPEELNQNYLEMRKKARGAVPQFAALMLGLKSGAPVVVDQIQRAQRRNNPPPKSTAPLGYRKR